MVDLKKTARHGKTRTLLFMIINKYLESNYERFLPSCSPSPPIRGSFLEIDYIDLFIINLLIKFSLIIKQIYAAFIKQQFRITCWKMMS